MGSWNAPFCTHGCHELPSDLSGRYLCMKYPSSVMTSRQNSKNRFATLVSPALSSASATYAESRGHTYEYVSSPYWSMSESTLARMPPPISTCARENMSERLKSAMCSGDRLSKFTSLALTHACQKLLAVFTICSGDFLSTYSLSSSASGMERAAHIQ